MGVVQRLKNTLLSKKITEHELFSFIKKEFTCDNDLRFIGELPSIMAHKCPKNIALKRAFLYH